MKSVDPGILSKSECFSFQPSEIAAKTMKHLTWCGHYFCTNSYFMERETYPYVPVVFVRNGNMDVRYNGKNYLIGKGGITNIFQEAFHIERILYLLSCEAEEKITETSPMEKIITHIHENFTRTITVNELAKLANVSPGHLAHTFKKQTGYAPSVYRKMQTSH